MVNTGSDGSVSITFYGTGLNDVSVFANNQNPDGFKIRLICVSDSSFDAYQLLPDGTVQLIESGIVPRSLGSEPPYIIDTEDGWFIKFESGNGYTVGDYWEIVMSGAPRGLLKKVNTIRIRLVEKSTGRIAQQEVKIIGFGKQPHDHHILFATADSSEAVEVLSSTENDDIRKNVYLHILNPNGIFEFEGIVEWDKAAGTSAYLPNTGVAFKARGELGSKNMTTSIFETPGEKVDKIKMRVGGNRQYGAFSSHEIVVRILNDMNLRLLGGVKNSVATWYLNGSYWSLGFPQEQPKKRFFERVLGIDKDVINIVTPFSFDLYVYSYYPGTQNGEPGNFMVFDKKSAEALNLSDTIVFFPLSFSNPEDIIQINSKFSNKKQMIGKINDGTGVEVEKIFNAMYSELNNSDSTESIQKFLDIDSWCRYITIIHFGDLGDIVQNNNDLVVVPNTKIFPVMTDFDGSGVWSGGDNWGHIFYGDVHNPQYKGIMRTILSLIHSSPSAMSRLALVYQDLLNTSLKSERTVAIVEDMRDAVMPEYGRMHASWGGSPNGGQSPEGQEQLYNNMRSFYEQRPEHAFQLMADYVLADHGFVNDDRNQVNIVFDSIPEGIVEVKFNSLTLYENFSGLYFPKPQVEVSYVVKDGYSVTIKEYQLFGKEFTLGADSTINITFVMRKDSVVNTVKDIPKSKVVVYPNPTQGMLNLDIDFFKTTPHFVEIYDSMGVKSIMSIKQKAVDVSSLTNGNYIIQIIDEDKIYKGQFVKVK